MPWPVGCAIFFVGYYTTFAEALFAVCWDAISFGCQTSAMMRRCDDAMARVDMLMLKPKREKGPCFSLEYVWEYLCQCIKWIDVFLVLRACVL